MKVLLTGATGYIGQQLLPKLIRDGHEVLCLVRSPEKFQDHLADCVTLIQGDLSSNKTLDFPKDLDAAFYLVHSMASQAKDFHKRDMLAAKNFLAAVENTDCKQIVYLGGIASDQNLSKHLSSRRKVEEFLYTGKIPVTALRTGIIIGSGSASFEILRDLTEKIPIMVTPNWIAQLCQPIAIDDVVDYLKKVLGNRACLGKSFEIAGPDEMTYKEAMKRYAKFRGLHRAIFVLPLLTPRLSALWLYFITSVNFPLSRALIEGVRNRALKKNNAIDQIIPKKCLPYEEALTRAFAITDSPPKFGCYFDRATYKIHDDAEATIQRIWSLFGKRTKWFRILVEDKKRGYLLLFAKMKLPGEAWLEFQVKSSHLHQLIVFRPKGLWGRMYWLFTYPLHLVLFRRLAKKFTYS